MQQKKADADETKRVKARNLRYKKAIAKDINLEQIREDLYDIMEACDDVRYYFEDDDDTLINALDGNEDEAFEFKVLFGDLSAECESMHADLQWEYIPDCFDNFFVAIGKGEQLLGWDPYEGDYFGLSFGYEDELARKEAEKRLLRLGKQRLIEAAQRCFVIFRAYIGLMHRYDCLKAAIDILRDKNTGYLQLVKQINEAYEKANKASDGFKYDWGQEIREYDRLLSCMPDMAWIQ